ncbi:MULTISPECIES: helix-turn-helix domain-containing protein [Sphingobacterium]|uniref:Helix-turn-helix domain-containing protein n=1 Tax=Sphingobacterium hotanense TaxID=649196 RepID=A0ABT7NKZ1_9SPHI|nr:MULTISPECIES: helix-turn-helix domain-containing protein [Sphingobacterium]MDM1047573.1 helix-turn-helix domain-containing protein [Sphingobacterium hotanense]
MINKAIAIKDKTDPSKLLKVALFDQKKCITKPHKHNGYLELVLLERTLGKHYIDGHEIQVKAPCLLIIRKDNVHHWELSEPVEGYVLLLKRQFVEESLDLEIRRLIDELEDMNTINFKDISTLHSLFSLLLTEEHRTVQEALLKAILAKSVQQIATENPIKIKSKNLFLQFTDVLNKEKQVLNNVAYYAGLLHTSPQNLNAACQKYADKSASEILSSYISSEAKRLLFYTNKTVAEVAFELGFADRSNFSKYFKRVVGLTPQNYRKMTD